ncbi:PE-PPE domain-containing protein [Mycolicibacterium rufum]|uniref:PE-PPE domain-containing protein n=1 Tax=Mycolicibacterium rufum TaxID=318424 RepID=A0A9X2Y390_9MYCO|nr:PE-PPE domain-containing protein [Mycolicibacterium rufum]MCV7073141.1 PE-PPE domain-containing protein [Mycolicibacterium rufum]ULP39281.1 PE-PPE domain-containing protein [Mycolicibacterium rufum]
MPLPVTPYDTLIVKAEYDGVADFPDRPLHLLADVNALMGARELHVDAAFSDILHEPTKYTITTNALGGTTTTVLIPTPLLPLLSPLRDAGASPQVLATMDKVLRPIINTAYRRPRWQVGIPETVRAPLPSAPADAGPATIPASTVLPTRHTHRAPATSRADRADTAHPTRLVARLQHSLRDRQQELSRRHAVSRRQDGVTQAGDDGR